MEQPTLYLMLGYPGAGKTTAAKIIADLTNAAYLSSDELRRKLFRMPTFTEHEHAQLYSQLDRDLETVMKEGHNVIYDANLNRKRHRQEKYELAKRYGYQTKLIWVQTAKELAKTRRISDPSHHDLVPADESPASMFERTVRVFEPPPRGEASIALDGTDVTSKSVRQALGL